MNIVVPATSFPRWENDAAGRFVLDLSRGLAERGHRLIHIVPQQMDSRTRPRATVDGLETRYFSVGLGNWAKKLCYGVGMGANLKARPWLGVAVPGLIRRIGLEITKAINDLPDAVILSHWAFPCGVAAAKVAKKQHCRHVNVIHGGGLQALLRSPMTRPWLRSWAQGTQGFVFVTDDLKEKAKSGLGRDLIAPSIVQPMGIDSKRFMAKSTIRSLPSLKAIAQDTLILLAVGRLIPLKGFDILIEAAARLKNVHLLICGEGPQRGALEAKGRHLQVACTFLGQLDPAELGQCYRAADFLVIPSRFGPNNRSEGSPMVALEAMSQGLAFVGSKSGGMVSLAAKSGAGVLFGVNDSHDLAQTIERLALDQQHCRSMKEEALRFAAAHEYSAVAKNVEKLILGV